MSCWRKDSDTGITSNNWTANLFVEAIAVHLQGSDKEKGELRASLAEQKRQLKQAEDALNTLESNQSIAAQVQTDLW